jgi:hypothetical protein
LDEELDISGGNEAALKRSGPPIIENFAPRCAQAEGKERYARGDENAKDAPSNVSKSSLH